MHSTSKYKKVSGFPLFFSFAFLWVQFDVICSLFYHTLSKSAWRGGGCWTLSFVASCQAFVLFFLTFHQLVCLFFVTLKWVVCLFLIPSNQAFYLFYVAYHLVCCCFFSHTLDVVKVEGEIFWHFVQTRLFSSHQVIILSFVLVFFSFFIFFRQICEATKVGVTFSSFCNDLLFVSHQLTNLLSYLIASIRWSTISLK